MAAITPFASATNVGTNAVVRLVFSERIDPISVTDTSLRLTNSGTSLTIDTEPTISEDRLSVTLTPVQPLQAQTSYTVFIAGVGDLAGNAVSFLTSSFTTGGGGDTTGPVVVEVSPAAGLSNVPVNARVVVRVSEPVTAASVSGAPLTVTAGGGGAVAGTAVLSSDRQTVTWTPAGSLAVSTTYAVSVSGWQDDSGNAVTPFGSSFTTRAVATADTTGPTVSTVSPTNGATGVGVTTPVVVTFSEAGGRDERGDGADGDGAEPERAGGGQLHGERGGGDVYAGDAVAGEHGAAGDDLGGAGPGGQQQRVCDEHVYDGGGGGHDAADGAERGAGGWRRRRSGPTRRWC